MPLGRPPKPKPPSLEERAAEAFLNALPEGAGKSRFTAGLDHMGEFRATIHTEHLGEFEVRLQAPKKVTPEEIVQAAKALTNEALNRIACWTRIEEYRALAVAAAIQTYGNLGKVIGNTLIGCTNDPIGEIYDPKEKGWVATYRMYVETLREDLTYGIENLRVNVFNRDPNYKPGRLTNDDPLVTMFNTHQQQAIRLRQERKSQGVMTTAGIDACLNMLGEKRREHVARFLEIGSIHMMPPKEKRPFTAVSLEELRLEDGLVTGKIRLSKDLIIDKNKVIIKGLKLPETILHSLQGKLGSAIADHPALLYSTIIDVEIDSKGKITLKIEDETRPII